MSANPLRKFTPTPCGPCGPPSQALYLGNDPREDVPGPQAIGMPVVLIDRNSPGGNSQMPVIHDLRELPPLIRSHFEAP